MSYDFFRGPVYSAGGYEQKVPTKVVTTKASVKQEKYRGIYSPAPRKEPTRVLSEVDKMLEGCSKAQCEPVVHDNGDDDRPYKVYKSDHAPHKVSPIAVDYVTFQEPTYVPVITEDAKKVTSAFADKVAWAFTIGEKSNGFFSVAKKHAVTEISTAKPDSDLVKAATNARCRIDKWLKGYIEEPRFYAMRKDVTDHVGTSVYPPLDHAIYGPNGEYLGKDLKGYMQVYDKYRVNGQYTDMAWDLARADVKFLHVVFIHEDDLGKITNNVFDNCNVENTVIVIYATDSIRYYGYTETKWGTTKWGVRYAAAEQIRGIYAVSEVVPLRYGAAEELHNKGLALSQTMDFEAPREATESTVEFFSRSHTCWDIRHSDEKYTQKWGNYTIHKYGKPYTKPEIQEYTKTVDAYAEVAYIDSRIRLALEDQNVGVCPECKNKVHMHFDVDCPICSHTFTHEDLEANRIFDAIFHTYPAWKYEDELSSGALLDDALDDVESSYFEDDVVLEDIPEDEE